jgi:ectoine hydroxylase-related dioxygenase (phytanoyl-CoA dioxygenase family)
MFELSDAQVQQFRRDGLLLVEDLLDAVTVDRLRERYERLFRGEFETGVAPDEVNWREGKSDPSLTRQICNGWKADRLIASVVFREDLGRAIARLAGWSGARVMIDNVIWKPAGTRSLGYHQDNAYQHWHQPGELLSCWMALDDTTAEGGTMELVRGSHRWHHSKPEGEFHGPENYRAPMEKAAAREGVQPDIVPVVVRKGGGSFHHGWTWHGSGPNHSAMPRRSLVLHAMPAEVRFAAEPRDLVHGVGGIYARYKRLNSDVIDENYFPVIWREDGYRTPGLEEYCRLEAAVG